MTKSCLQLKTRQFANISIKRRKFNKCSTSASLLIKLIEFLCKVDENLLIFEYIVKDFEFDVDFREQLKVDEFFKANHWKSNSRPDHARFLTLRNGGIKSLLGSFDKFGNWVGIKIVFEILSSDFFNKFKISKINKKFFWSGVTQK